MYELAEILSVFATREKCIIGVCSGEALPHIPGCDTPFISRNILKRTDPAASLPGVKSIIVIGVEPKVEKYPPMPEGAGILSILGAVEDYHVAIKALLTKLVAELKHKFAYKILVDSPALDERALAVRAGLGYIGRSGLVISPEYGSRFNIGLLLTDIVIKNNIRSKSQTSCPPSCRKCIDACPTGALSESKGVNPTRCISYLTQKDNLTQEESSLMGRHLYGCDICQNACPKNRPLGAAWANPNDWLSMSDDDFVKAYGHTAMMWRGPAILRRNAKIAAQCPKPRLKINTKSSIGFGGVSAEDTV